MSDELKRRDNSPISLSKKPAIDSPSISTHGSDGVRCCCHCGKMGQQFCKLLMDIPKIISDGAVIAVKGVLAGKSQEKIAEEVFKEVIHDAVEYAENEIKIAELNLETTKP